MLGKKKRKKMMMKEESRGAIAGGDVSVEMGGDVEIVEGEGGFLTEDEDEGIQSPVMMSPTGSLMGDEVEEEIE